jgi:hypothetical protein
VPLDAGLSITFAAAKSSRTSCGIVVPTIGIRTMCFFASSRPCGWTRGRRRPCPGRRRHGRCRRLRRSPPRT